MITVVKPGLLTTVQDLGRYGYQKFGVVVCGAMDAFALRIANVLVGNAEGCPALEITLVGPRLEFERDALIAVTGRGLAPRIQGTPVPAWRPVLVRAGAVLDFVPEPAGCRAYLAVAGGIAVPEVMGSYSTYLRAGIGGLRGRALQAGDVLPVGEPSERGRTLIAILAKRRGDGFFCAAAWSVDPTLLPAYRPHPTVRAMPGPQFHVLTAEAKRTFFHSPFPVMSQSDRMGYRLSGPVLAMSRSLEMISEAVAAGTVQVPPDGHPVILLADRQTIGGYPKIAQVATVDLPLLAQVRPGDRVQFAPVALEEAQALLRQREREIRRLLVALKHVMTVESR
ncbi:MAG: biotin-dependent carboxyltransferase family protein [Kyrpidia sp.]|nr:biotin-dependent carboxyltransferase family protein [Kyrpidia sp.]